jgi:subtilisin family serine protease
MGIRSSLPLLVAMTAALHNLSVPPGMLAEASSRESSSSDSANHFWQSVDLEESTGSLEWMLKDDHHVSSAKQQEPSTERIAQKTPNSSSSKRSLRQIKKEHMDDFHWPSTAEEKHRLLIRCKADQEQEGCVSDLFRRSKNRNPIKIVHNLKAINALSIEVDSETRDVLFADDFDLHRDFERAPLVEREEPLTDETRRKLQDGQQEGWGLRTVRAKQVWDVYGVRGGGVKVCILDTGLDVDHEDFVELTVDGYIGEEAVEPWYEDRRGHGTHITGIIAASDNNLGTL